MYVWVTRILQSVDRRLPCSSEGKQEAWVLPYGCCMHLCKVRGKGVTLIAVDVSGEGVRSSEDMWDTNEST